MNLGALLRSAFYFGVSSLGIKLILLLRLVEINFKLNIATYKKKCRILKFFCPQFLSPYVILSYFFKLG